MAAPTSITTDQPEGSGDGAAPANVSDPAPGVIVTDDESPPFAPGEKTMPSSVTSDLRKALFCLIHRLRSMSGRPTTAARQGATKSVGAVRHVKLSQLNTSRVSICSVERGLAG